MKKVGDLWMAAYSSVRGLVVGSVDREYDFLDRDTNERKAGTTMRVHLSEGLDDEPVAVVFRPTDPASSKRMRQMFDTIASCGFLARCEIECTTKTFGREVVYYAAKLNGVEPAVPAEAAKA